MYIDCYLKQETSQIVYKYKGINHFIYATAQLISWSLMNFL